MASAMKWTGKIVGGLLGLLTVGPWGGLLGFLVGHQFDGDAGTGSRPGSGGVNEAPIRERLFRSTFRVMGFLAKADGRVSEAEIVAARKAMAELNLDPAHKISAISYFSEGKQPGFDLERELANLRQVCVRRPDLLHVFVELQVRAALAGNNMEGPVRAYIHHIAARLEVSPLEVSQIEAVQRIRNATGYTQQTLGAAQTPQERLDEAYRVLEVPAGSTDPEIVRAYRRQLSRHHPDKLKANGLPETMIENAKRQTQQIIEAYELIRERRGMS